VLSWVVCLLALNKLGRISLAIEVFRQALGTLSFSNGMKKRELFDKECVSKWPSLE